MTKNDFKEYEQFLELSKRLKIQVNNEFIEMQRQQLLTNDEIQEEGLLGEILKLVRKTFEDLANYALAYQQVGKSADELVQEGKSPRNSVHDLELEQDNTTNKNLAGKRMSKI